MVRLVAEHGMKRFSVHARTKALLSFGQFVEFIDNACPRSERRPERPVVESYIEYGASGDIDSATLESDVYPELGEYYARRLCAWDASKRVGTGPAERDEDEE